MHRCSQRIRSVACSILVLAAVVQPATGTVGFIQDNIGASYYTAQTAGPIAKWPPLKTVFDYPAAADTSIPLPFFSCQVQVGKAGKGVAKAKGTYSLSVLVIDPLQPSLVKDLQVKKEWRFRTDAAGNANVDVRELTDFAADLEELPQNTEHAFYSVFVWSFVNKKKADSARIVCGARTVSSTS